jgi:GrpB-like predicted nucleotidyltransferase (UPF0157 family)
MGTVEVVEQVEAVIGPYTNHPAACRKYDPRAVEVAGQIAALIQSHLPPIGVEHVGSTAVPGCAGKGIVDLMIPVSAGDMGLVKERLDRLGFQHQAGSDAFPEDRPMRTGAWTHDGETFFLHVHVIPADSPEVDAMRFFRACLRADPELVKAYVARKREIISDGITDSAEYCRIKGEFLKAVLG